MAGCSKRWRSSIAIKGVFPFDGAEWGLVAPGATMIMVPVTSSLFIQQYHLAGLGGVRFYPQQHLTKRGST